MDQEFRELLRKEASDNLTELDRFRLDRIRRLITPDYQWAHNQIEEKIRPPGSDEDLFDYADNVRIARTCDAQEMSNFEKVREDGCCGSMDWEVVDPHGVRWILGFNYGH